MRRFLVAALAIACLTAVPPRAGAACFVKAGRLFHVSPLLLYSIYLVEQGRSGYWRMNANGSRDLGLMQINDRAWGQWLHERFGITEQLLVRDDCVNVMAAAAILRKHINDLHGNVPAAVARYHSRTPALGRRYLSKVKRRYAWLLKRARKGGRR